MLLPIQIITRITVQHGWEFCEPALLSKLLEKKAGTTRIDRDTRIKNWEWFTLSRVRQLAWFFLQTNNLTTDINSGSQAGMISNPRSEVGRKVESSWQQIIAQFSFFWPLLLQSTVNSQQSTMIPVQPESIWRILQQMVRQNHTFYADWESQTWRTLPMLSIFRVVTELWSFA